MAEYSLNNTFVLSALNMGSERAASQLIICRHKHGRIELKGDLKKREALRALEKIIIESLNFFLPEEAFVYFAYLPNFP